jgi:hypothetical protein
MEGLLWIRTLSMWAVKMWYACLQSRVTCKPPWLLQSSFPCWIGHSLVCLRIDSNNRPGSHMLCSRLPSYLQFFPRLYLSDLIGSLCSCTSFGCFLWIIWCSTHFLLSCACLATPSPISLTYGIFQLSSIVDD